MLGGDRAEADKGCRNGAEHADQIIQVEPEASPLILQIAAYQIIEIQGKYDPDRAGGRGEDQKSHQTPYLALQDLGRIQCEFGIQLALGYQKGQDENNRIQYYDV